MHRVDGDANVAGMFDEGTPGGQDATVMTDDWANAVQEEIIAVITAAGITLDKPTNTQLRSALYALFGRLGTTNTWTAANTFDVDGAGWQSLPLNTAGNWAALGGAIVPQYRVDSFGRVWLRGEATRSSGTNITIGTLPSGARPPSVRGGYFVVMSDDASGISVLQVAGVGASGLANPGDIQVLTNPTDNVSLHGVAFYIDGK